MIGTQEKENDALSEKSRADFALGIDGFYFSDLYDAARLKEIAEKFYAEIEESEPVLGAALKKYVAARGADYEPKVESKILTDAAPYLSAFVARLFNVSEKRENLLRLINEQDPIWSYKFFVQRRAIKKYKAEDLGNFNEAELNAALSELKHTAFDDVLIYDEELAIAT